MKNDNDFFELLGNLEQANKHLKNIEQGLLILCWFGIIMVGPTLLTWVQTIWTKLLALL